MALPIHRKVLIVLLCIALLFLILIIATYCLWGFKWSPWSRSEKCSTFCQSVINNVKTLERPWSGNLADLIGVLDNDVLPDDSWANISEELYTFLVPPPPAFPDTGKDVPTTTKETTSQQTTTTDKCPNRYPPIASITWVKSITFYDKRSVRAESHYLKYIYICTGAVLGRTYAVITKSCLYKYRDDYSRISVQINSNYTRKAQWDNENWFDYEDFQVEYFKDLAKIRFKKAINDDCFRFTELLKHNVELKIASAFLWTAGKPDQPVRKIEVAVKGKSILSTPLFMIKDKTYFLFGFAANGRIIPNIYSTEYGKWLEKP